MRQLYRPPWGGCLEPGEKVGCDPEAALFKMVGPAGLAVGTGPMGPRRGIGGGLQGGSDGMPDERPLGACHLQN